jgi:uncharacterized membrane protein
MTNDQDKINKLLQKVDDLLKRQDSFYREINSLKAEIDLLKNHEAIPINSPEKIEHIDPHAKVETINKAEAAKPEPEHSTASHLKTRKIKGDLEKFIGENLINKIGILITVFGVAIGAKYSIENELISPLTRIILGYITGIALLGLGIRLKKNYISYSAVLVSGAMAIMYFITYAAFSFYGLFPQFVAFLLMLIFTVFTVVAAIKYNQQVIAHIGLVGAYAVPFLLSEGSGKAEILFGYMTIINGGILIIAFKKYWKSLYYSAFIFTWLIFFAWYAGQYDSARDVILALTFLSLFFIIFYIIFLAYKLIQKEKYDIGDVLLLILNSFIFFGLGYGILSDSNTGEQLLGIFTLCNAFIHFSVSLIIFRHKLADSNLFYLVVGLVLVFLTITIPVQLDGNWVTLLWAGEAALLFWIGRTKKVVFYETLSYPLMYLAFFSLIQDWLSSYGNYYPENPESYITPILNINFLTSILFIAAFAFINYLHLQKEQPVSGEKNGSIHNLLSLSIPGILLIVVYFAFRIEIANYWDQIYANSTLAIAQENQDYPVYYSNFDLQNFKSIWILIYSLFFVSVLTILNNRKLPNHLLAAINVWLIVLAIGVFLVQGLYVLSELRDSYLYRTASDYYQIGIFHLLIRYVSFSFTALAFYTFYKYTRQEFANTKHTTVYNFLLHIALLWIGSSELLHWLDLAEFAQSYKLALSILWGIWSLSLIVLGIWKNQKYLRIGAIILFGITLLKLFFYDISNLDTIAKTIVLVSLGVLLLIISFLYNKYKHKIFAEIDN